jgi:hypothetical protein
MAEKRKRTEAERNAWNERTRRLDDRLGGIFSRTTFEERTRMIEARIAELEARAAAKSAGRD